MSDFNYMSFCSYHKHVQLLEHCEVLQTKDEHEILQYLSWLLNVTRNLLNHNFMFYFLAVVVCDPPCENGVCVANDICNCTIGYEGDRCTEPTEKSMYIYTSVGSIYNVSWYC